MSPIDNGLQDEEKSFEWVKKGRDLTHLPLIAVMTFPTILNDIDSAPRRIDVNLIEMLHRVCNVEIQYLSPTDPTKPTGNRILRKTCSLHVNNGNL